MNMTKKLLTVFFAFLFAIILSACGRSTGGDEDDLRELLDDIEASVASWDVFSYHRMFHRFHGTGYLSIVESKHIDDLEGRIMMRSWNLADEDVEKERYWIYIEDGVAYVYYDDLMGEEETYTKYEDPAQYESDLPDVRQDLSLSLYLIRRALNEDYYDTLFEELEIEYDRESGEFDVWVKVDDRGTTQEWRTYGDLENINIESPYENVGTLLFEKKDFFEDFEGIDKTKFE